MQQKAIKQRLLGGLVLIAGAALFLPILLDGSGASLSVPPMPPAPEVAGVEAMAPQLDQKVKEAEQAVDRAHAGATDGAGDMVATAPSAQDVAPDAAAVAADQSGPAQAMPPASTAAPTLGAKPTADQKPAPVQAAPEKARADTPVAKASPAPSASIGVPDAWVVQVASLSSRDKAEELVRKLRGKNYAAVLRPQGSSWKVLVGPELNHDVAETLKARLAADPDLHLSGWVQAYKP